MDGFYRGVETSLLALSLALGLAAAVFSLVPQSPVPWQSAVTLPMISVTAGE